MENTIHYLELSKDPIRFDVASQLTSVFFDDSNKQVNSSVIDRKNRKLITIYLLPHLI